MTQSDALESRCGRRAAHAAGEHALPVGCERGRAGLMSPLAQVVVADAQDATADRTTAEEAAALDGRDRVRQTSVAIVDAMVTAGVDVRDVRVVDDDRVRVIDAADVARRMPVSRHEHFVRCEREASDVAAECEQDRRVRAPDPTDEGGRIDRTQVARAGYPT